MAEDPNVPERPRVEPEIIPPDHSRDGWERPTWRSAEPVWKGATHRVYIGRIGPFGFAIVMLALVVVAAILFLAILGAALIWLPVVALAAVAAGLYRLLR